MSTKTNWKIRLWLFGKSKANSTQEASEKVLRENDNSKGTSSQSKEVGAKVHV